MGKMAAWPSCYHIGLVIKGSLDAWVQILTEANRFFFLQQETIHSLLSTDSKNVFESASISLQLSKHSN